MYMMSIALGILVLLVMFFFFIKPAVQWALNKEDPFARRNKVLLMDSIYCNNFKDSFKMICQKAKIDFDKLKIHILLNDDNLNSISVNASAWQTVRTKNNVYIEEGAFIYFENYPEIVEAIFAHEVGHLKKNDSLWKYLINEYGPFFVPFIFYLSIFIIGTNIENLAKHLQNPYSEILYLTEALIIIIGVPAALVLLFSSRLIPTWHFQISEIRADIFAANICGKEPIDLFLSVLEENEILTLEQCNLFMKFKMIYNSELNEHPSATLRRKLIQKTNRIGIVFRIKHYIRLLFWMITGRGFYGEYFFLKARKSVTN